MSSVSPPFRSDTLRRLLGQLDTVCVAVAAPQFDQVLATSSALLPKHRFQEFRLDSLPDPAASLPALAKFLADQPALTLLATFRPRRSGGYWECGAAEELAVLQGAAAAGASLVDLSLESAEELGAAALDSLRQRGAVVMVSHHDFELTGDLDAVLARMRRLSPDLCKIVPTAEKLQDSVRLLRLLRGSRGAEAPAVVAVAMGEAGVLTRVLGPREGSAFTFAAASEAEATAPGQLTAEILADLYRVRSLGPTTEIFGVAGDPISASLSPLMQNTAFREAGLNSVYLPLKTRDATELFQVAEVLPLAGCSVTMPLKQNIRRYLADVEPLAERIGAVNTLVRRADGRYVGYNTDADGIAKPLQTRLKLRGARVLVLGAGGAGRAAVFACVDRGAEVFVVNRTEGIASQLAREAGATALAREQLRRRDFDVLINATPAGMRGHALSLPLEREELRAGLVFDLVYNPLETSLLALARQTGAEVIPGVEMFVHQGARQFELWTGQPAPVEAMREVVLRELSRSEPGAARSIVAL